MRKFFKRALLLPIACLILSSTAEGRVVDEHIFLIPVGNVDTKMVEAVKDKLPGFLAARVKVNVEPRREMPEGAYAPSRGQYYAELVLAGIAQEFNIDTTTESILIITDADLYSQDLDHVFGAADPSKAIGMISIARLRNEFYSLKPDSGLLLERVVKESLRELGCAWKIPQCSNPECIMYPSDSLKTIDSKKRSFCYKCQSKIRNRYFPPIFKAKIPTLL
ncbi:MAG: hypothetical protein PHN63_05650 [Candidatus Omnitrophica bacterium]|nr:hypothetical protein [Candidatus Omnitrophota bacterium]